MTTVTEAPAMSGSVVAEQTAALRAGMALLAMVDTVPLDLSVDARRKRDGAAQLDVTIDLPSGSEQDPERLEGFRTVAELLNLTVDAFDSDYTTKPTMYALADTSIAGTPVHFWLSLTDPDTIAAAHLAFPTLGGAAA